jgi:hypothetical protein
VFRDLDIDVEEDIVGRLKERLSSEFKSMSSEDVCFDVKESIVDAIKS